MILFPDPFPGWFGERKNRIVGRIPLTGHYRPVLRKEFLDLEKDFVDMKKWQHHHGT
jgi:hypothetical protein